MRYGPPLAPFCKAHLAELDVRVRGRKLAVRAIQQVVLQRDEHHVEALRRQLLGDRLSDAWARVGLFGVVG